MSVLHWLEYNYATCWALLLRWHQIDSFEKFAEYLLVSSTTKQVFIEIVFKMQLSFRQFRWSSFDFGSVHINILWLINVFTFIRSCLGQYLHCVVSTINGNFNCVWTYMQTDQGNSRVIQTKGSLKCYCDCKKKLSLTCIQCDGFLPIPVKVVNVLWLAVFFDFDFAGEESREGRK